MVQARYHKLQYDNNGTMEGVQVDSAVRDEDGYRFKTAYPKKAGTEQEISEHIIRTYNSYEYTITHGLNDIPSSVEVYIKDNGEWKSIMANVYATANDVRVVFDTLPQYASKVKIKLLV